MAQVLLQVKMFYNSSNPDFLVIVPDPRLKFSVITISILSLITFCSTGWNHLIWLCCAMWSLMDKLEWLWLTSRCVISAYSIQNIVISTFTTKNWVFLARFCFGIKFYIKQCCFFIYDSGPACSKRDWSLKGMQCTVLYHILNVHSSKI